ncbi:hypothetical protein EDC96DRAFT_532261 [Choanephora cucurbitarum]|nr:hypothetical protein EDC96DRAFT_532261 [Choanephora cucurbitarum]
MVLCFLVFFFSCAGHLNSILQSSTSFSSFNSSSILRPEILLLLLPLLLYFISLLSLVSLVARY